MTVWPIEDELLGAGHHALQHRDMTGMRGRLSLSDNPVADASLYASRQRMCYMAVSRA
jgi:hypothetical protein